MGMLADCSHPAVIKDHFTRASNVLGYDLWELTQQGPEHLLNQTDKTQPAILTASVALYQFWEQQQTKNSQHLQQPKYLSGHSLGEYTALVIAGTLTFEQAVHLVALRGRLMQQAVPAGKGAMAAVIGLKNEEVEQICMDVYQRSKQGKSKHEQFVAIANYNAPGQVVIAGHDLAVHHAIDLCRKKKAKMVVPLAVSVPSHTPLMQPMTEAFADALEQITFTAPKIPVLQNATSTIEYDSCMMKKNLLDQLVKPVYWTKIINILALQGVTQIVECGPGKVLTGLNKRINKAVESISFHNLETCP